MSVQESKKRKIVGKKSPTSRVLTAHSAQVLGSRRGKKQCFRKSGRDREVCKLLCGGKGEASTEKGGHVVSEVGVKSLMS